MLQHGTWIILKEKNPLPLPGSEPRTVQPRSLLAISTALFRLPTKGTESDVFVPTEN
jgi:hypothetical protein